MSGPPDEPFARRTADPIELAPWVAELVRTLPDLVRSYVPGGPIDARTRERLMLTVTEVNGCRYSRWAHRSWSAFLGAVVEDPDAAELSVLSYARASAEAGRPLDPGRLGDQLPAGVLGAAQAVIAQIEVSNLVGNTVDGLVAVLRGRRRVAPARLAGEAAAVVAALPLAAPVMVTGALLGLVDRLAPPLPAVRAPAEEDANLLVHVLVRTVPAYLANAGVRLVALRLPAPVAIGLRAGRTAATVRIGRGRVAIDNGIGSDAVVVLEGDLEPILQLATGSMLRELRNLRLRRD